MADLWNQLLTGALPLLVNVVAMLALAVTAWLFLRLERLIVERVSDERVKTFLLRLNDTVRDVVLELEQTTVDDLKAKAADGKLTSEERTDLRNTAKVRVLARLGEEAKKGAAAMQIDDEKLSRVIVSKIESTVAAVRAGKVGAP